MGRRKAGDASAPASGFKGNKSFLPSKPCVACGREMTWRKSWERNWDQVRYCCEACRRAGPASSA
ncbi:DUF2256 domain-containing protein [Xylophilus sp. Kf1]|nr:DUF2256 domain-containing protein [Xylophilus sp. Kf1]